MAKSFKNFIKFVDSVSFNPEIKSEVKDYFANPQNSAQTLRIRIAATHAGKITRNNGFYLPHKMRSGAASFTDQYPKPIQVHHESHEDPVGRVIQARYVDLSGGFRDSVKDSFSVSKDKQLQDFVAGNMSNEKLIDFARKTFINDESIVDDPDYEGLGYIELVADISDPAAIQKVLDKRYLTGSVGATTDSAVCSVCKTDWAGDDGRCEHIPGKVYDKKKCVLIAGDLRYDEWSFVNKPADTHSSVIEVHNGGMQDFVKVEKGSQGEVPEVNLVIDTKEEKGMLFKDAFALVSKDERFQGLENLEDCVKQLLDSQEDLNEERLLELMSEQLTQEEPAKDEVQDEATEDASEESAAQEGTDDTQSVEDEDQSNEDASDEESEEDVQDEAGDQTEESDEEVEDDVEEEVQDEEEEESEEEDTDPVADFFGDSYQELIEDDASGREYAEMLFGLLDGVEDEGRDEVVKMINDAKLSSKQRKALPSSSFSGPERSFPVPDCAHYTAALRLLGRYKGPGDKSRIRACIERKGKRLGCSGAKDEAQDAEQILDQFSVEYFDGYSDDELIKMLEGLMACLDERKLDCKCHDEDEEKSRLQDRVSSLQKEIKYLHEDIDNLSNVLADSEKTLRGLKVEKIIDLKKLTGVEVDPVNISDELQDKSSSDVDEILKDLTGQVDIDKIADKLNSGLSNNPQGTVEDPTAQVDNTTEKNSEGSKPKYDPKVAEQALANYVELRFKKGQQVADAYLADLQTRGVLPVGGKKVEDKS